MVKAYEGKLSEFVIPVEELGFDPLVPTNIEWDLHILNRNPEIIARKHFLIPLSFNKFY